MICKLGLLMLKLYIGACCVIGLTAKLGRWDCIVRDQEWNILGSRCVNLSRLDVHCKAMWLPIRYIFGTDISEMGRCRNCTIDREEFPPSHHHRQFLLLRNCGTTLFQQWAIELYPTRERPRTWGFSRLGAVKTSTHEWFPGVSIPNFAKRPI